ncbi:MAG TPA: hypothetical protein VHG51_11270, partial [Longimicrobiaceae bacterium]|nr:hypothetical protein [Longimicrobiaceae bacterium]
MDVLRLSRPLAVAAALAAAPAALPAQAPVPGGDAPRRAVSLMAGGFGSDINEGATFGIAAARLDQRFSRVLVGEV